MTPYQLFEAEAARYHRDNPDLRWGQAYYVTLRREAPLIADELDNHPDLDPFYRSHVPYATRDFVAEIGLAIIARR